MMCLAAGGKARKFKIDENGVGAVEFALILPVLITIIFAGIEFALIFFAYNAAGHTAWSVTRDLATNVTLASGANVTGSGVTFFFDAASTLSLGGTGSANLAASTSGPYEGVLIFQSRSTPKASTPVSIGGSGDMQINGAIYVPSATINLGGNSSYGSKFGYLIANKMQVGGSSSFGLNAFGANSINPDSINIKMSAGLVQ